MNTVLIMQGDQCLGELPLEHSCTTARKEVLWTLEIPFLEVAIDCSNANRVALHV